MRLAAVLVLAAACYRPTAPAGSPCDPIDPHCPTGQMCFAGACSNSATFEDAPLAIDVMAIVDATLIDAAPIDAPIAIDAMPDAALPALHIDYAATVADCIDPTLPDPTKCTNRNGPSQLVVDGMDTITGNPWQSFVRFEIDGQLAGRTVTTVKLVLVATNDPKANGPDSGEIFTVTAFTHLSLNGTTPTQLAQIAPSQGNVSQGNTVTWMLPIAIVTANQPVYLGIYTSSGDGVNYWNLTGPKPPVLHVDTL